MNINPLKIHELATKYTENAHAATLARLMEQENTKPIFPSINELTVGFGGGVVSQSITADSDGDFQITGITGTFSLIGFPLSGIVTVQITDQATGYKLTNGYIPFHLLVNPGYIAAATFAQRFYPTAFQFTILRNTTLQFDFINSHAANNAVVNVLLEGKKVK